MASRGIGPDAASGPLSLRVSFSTDWDDGPVPLVLAERAVVSARPGPPGARRVRSVPPVRIERGGGLLVLVAVHGPAGGPQPLYRLVRVDPAGAVQGWSELGLDADFVEGWHVLDFQPDHTGGIYVLEALQSPTQDFERRVRRVAPTGATVWSRRAPLDTRRLDFDELAGKFEHLVVPTEDAVFLPSRYPVQGVARLDADSGQVAAVYDVDEPFDELTVDAGHRAYFSRRIEEDGAVTTIVVRRALDTGERDVLTPELDVFTALAGVDDSGRIYVRLRSGIARLSPEGTLDWRFEPHGVVVRRGDGHVFVLAFASAAEEATTLRIDHRGADGGKVAEVTATIGPDVLPPGVVPTLVHVDDDGTATLYAGETNHEPGVRYVVDADGRLLSATPLDGDGDEDTRWDRVNEELLPIESRVLPAAFQVDPRGGIVIPVSDPDGYRILRTDAEPTSVG